MNISEPFIKRPVATTLLTIGVVLTGVISFFFLPVSQLPQVDYPTISVSASLPGADPETMATSVASPLERQFGRIAGVTEMTSTSYRGSTSITLQFDLSRDIDGAARDVQGAINAARGFLPATLRSNPTYRKVNPADAPILIISLNSDSMSTSAMYDEASSNLQQKLSQVQGVGQVYIRGSSLPAVRVELNPLSLNRYGISLEEVRKALAATSLIRPKGELSGDDKSWVLQTNDQLHKAEEYIPLVIAYRNGAAVRLGDVADVQDSVEDVRMAGFMNGRPTVSIIIYRQPAANIIETVDRIRELLPQLKASLPEAIQMSVVVDRTPPIRASMRDVERTLIASVVLVILVVFLFLRNLRATVIPATAIAVSIIGTFAVMYLLGYSLNNLSLMALTVATGFVVDDAIVVLENVSRHREKGLSPIEAALAGSREIAFTVLSMSISLIAVFVPILMMEGMVGRLFREFAVTLSTAVMISLLVSLTATPMMCAAVLRPVKDERHGLFYRISERFFNRILHIYEVTLRWAIRHSFFMLMVISLTISVNIYLFVQAPKGFFPEQDSGRLSGSIQGAQDISFQSMKDKLLKVVETIKSDPDVEFVTGFTGGGSGSTTNTARMFITLKPFDERKSTARDIINRLRKKLSEIPGASTALQPVQDLRIGGRISSALYQFTLQGDSISELNEWGQKVLQKLRSIPEVMDVNSDQQDKGLEAALEIDRAAAARLGVTQQAIVDTLYDAFGQRQVSVNYKLLNQYNVVMEVDPRFWQDPEALKDIYVPSTSGPLVPLSAFASYRLRGTTLSVSHQGQVPSITISFNLAPGKSLGEVVAIVERETQKMGMPGSVRGSFSGTAQAFKDSLENEPILVLAALITVYIVLGVLYESYIHPVTIISTLPSAGVGAVLSLMLFGSDLNVIAWIGIILLIGIVKKNGILMVDFAVEVERKEGKTPEDAIFQACMLRFRPIMMTTMASLLGALPLALGHGVGSELRRPLGITIVGGLIFSQMLTLYTTPVVYLYLDRFRIWFAGIRDKQDRPHSR